MFESLKLLAQSYIVHTNRCLLVVSAIILGVAGLSAVLVLNESARNSYNDATQPLLRQVHYQIIARPGETLTQHDYATLRRAGYARLVPMLSKHVTLGSDSASKTASILGMDTFAILSLPVQYRPVFENVATNLAAEFAQIWQHDSLILHVNYAKELGLVEGQHLVLKNTKKTPPLTISDVPGLGRQIFTDIGVLQSLFGTHELDALFVIGEVDKTSLLSDLPTHLKLEKTNSGDDAAQLTGSFHLNLLAMALLMFVVCMFVVMNALDLLLIKRLRNLRILRQLGIARNKIFASMLLEVLVLCLLLTPPGVFLGIQLAQLLSPSVYRTLENLYAVNLSFEQFTYLSLIFKSAGAAIIGALAASIMPILQLNQRLASVSPVREHSETSKNNFVLSALLTFSALTIYTVFDGILWSFAIVALLVFAGCTLIISLLPIILSVFERHTPRHYPLLHWSLSDSLRISSHSKIAFCAFFIAVSTNIGMNLMVDSFRQATDSWLQQRLNADGYLYTEIPDEVIPQLKQFYSSVKIVPRYSATAIFNYQQVDVYSYPLSETFQQAMKFQRATTEAWQQFRQGDGVFISQQMAYSQQLGLDSEVNFHIGEHAFELKVKGIYFDYGNPKPQLLLPVNVMSNIPSQQKVFAVFVGPDSNLEDLTESLATMDPEARFYDTQSLLGLSMQAFNQTFVITNSLNIVTLLVAAFSLATSIIIIDLDNTRQRALMRSMGISRKRLALLGIGQYLLLSTIVCLLSIPFGIGLSWLLINLINVQAFNWSYPMLLEPWVILSVILSSLTLMAFGSMAANYIARKNTTQEELRCTD